MHIKKLKIPEQFGSLYVCPIPEQASKHETAHQLLNFAVQELFSIEMPVLAYGACEKPYFRDYPEIHFNLSHCDRLAVCLISEFECGADTEALRKLRPAVVRKVFTEEEQELLNHSEDSDRLFTRLWTLKESYVKAIGKGIGFPMKNVSFQFENQNIYCNQSNAEFHQMQYEGFEISLCILKNDIPPV